MSGMIPMLWVSTLRSVSRFYDQYVLDRRTSPWLRLIMLKTISTCQRWPYVS